jgi:hypothetical protein
MAQAPKDTLAVREKQTISFSGWTFLQQSSYSIDIWNSNFKKPDTSMEMTAKEPKRAK